jgi:hypothetical protein
MLGVHAATINKAVGRDEPRYYIGVNTSGNFVDEIVS